MNRLLVFQWAEKEKKLGSDTHLVHHLVCCIRFCLSLFFNFLFHYIMMKSRRNEFEKKYVHVHVCPVFVVPVFSACVCFLCICVFFGRVGDSWVLMGEVGESMKLWLCRRASGASGGRGHSRSSCASGRDLRGDTFLLFWENDVSSSSTSFILNKKLDFQKIKSRYDIIYKRLKNKC